MIRHAIGAEDKQARRAAILDAATALFNGGDGGLPAVADIAAAAGLGKGTVYLYFRTKEAIYATLLQEGWRALLDEVEMACKAARGRRADRIATFTSSYLSHLERHPELLRLDALGYGVLERNLEPEAMRAFKFAFADRLVALGGTVEDVLRLPRGRGVKLLTRTYALTRGLWQSAHPGDEAGALRDEPALAPLYPDFRTDLAEALTEYMRGALARP